MDLQTLSLDLIRSRTVAILGYGNQGRAHALNLRDSGVKVLVGARPGKGWDQAVRDGFTPLPVEAAVESAEVLMFLFPDQLIPAQYGALQASLQRQGKAIGFAHGFALHFGFVERLPNCQYFLVTPKGAGSLLRAEFEKGGGLPGVYAVDKGSRPETRELALSYAKGIGCATSFLMETNFGEETECDLFGEQAVLCGGIMELMEAAFEVLVANGHSAEMAFFECCFEARLILELWMQNGPAGMADKISPTAFFGGLTRGRRLITDDTRAELKKIFAEIRSGAFAREWMAEVADGMPRVKAEKTRLRQGPLQAVYEKLSLR